MSDIIIDTNVGFVKGKTKKPIQYEFKTINGKTKEILSIRRSKKSGSHYSNAFLDLVYLAGKLDPYWMDKLVMDKDFPLFLEQMRISYEKSTVFREGWSPETIKELEEYAKSKHKKVDEK